MNEEICIIAVCCDNYDFVARDGKYMAGTSYKVAVVYYHGGANIAYKIEVLKTNEKEYQKATAAVGKRCRGAVLFDRFGKFAGIGG